MGKTSFGIKFDIKIIMMFCLILCMITFYLDVLREKCFKLCNDSLKSKVEICQDF